MMSSISRIGFIVLSLALCFPQPVHAYIDPGTGSFIIQMLMAGALGLFFTLKVFWKKIITYFKNLFRTQNE